MKNFLANFLKPKVSPKAATNFETLVALQIPMDTGELSVERYEEVRRGMDPIWDAITTAIEQNPIAELDGDGMGMGYFEYNIYTNDIPATLTLLREKLKLFDQIRDAHFAYSMGSSNGADCNVKVKFFE